MATISINKSDYPNLSDCEVGEPLDLTGTVSAIKGDVLTIDVSDVEYGETEEEEPAPKSKVNPVTRIRPVQRGYA